MVWSRSLVIWGVTLAHLVLSQHWHRLGFWSHGGALQGFGEHTGQIAAALPFSSVVLRMLSYSLDLHFLRVGRSNGADIPSSSSTGDLKASLSFSTPATVSLLSLVCLRTYKSFYFYFDLLWEREREFED